MTEKRLIELELRYSELQHLLQELSDVLYQQQKQLDLLSAEVAFLKKKTEGEPGMVDASNNERPPHY